MKRLTVEERASREAPGYVWREGPTGTWVLAQSGNVYEVSDDTCTCVWFQIHHAPCKHIVAMRQRHAAMSANNMKGTRQ
jgi:hypothetical protein